MDTQNTYSELPETSTGPADDLWRVEFYVPVDGKDELCWQNNRPRRRAENFVANWKRQEGTAIFCRHCPDQDFVLCDHADAHYWPYSEITRVRIMPMREAL